VPRAVEVVAVLSAVVDSSPGLEQRMKAFLDRGLDSVEPWCGLGLGAGEIDGEPLDLGEVSAERAERGGSR
jgi:hypothetical protein